MPKLFVDRSIQIDAPVADVFAKLNDFNHWQSWSPWLIMEQGAKVTVSDDAKSYSWEGNRIGAGQMAITSEEANKKIQYDLEFLKPWKSQAKVWFDFAESAGGTKVTWYMDSSLPFFLFWMKAKTNAYIGMDYDRGLNMLKDYVETGSVPSELNLKGVETFGPANYVIKKTSTTIEDMPGDMQKDMGTLMEWAANNGGYEGYPITVYHKFDFVNRKVTYSTGLPVKDLPANPGNGFATMSIPAIQTYTVEHKGNYKHLGNAWSTGMNLSQNSVFKGSKKQHPFELYISDPRETDPNENVSEIRFPIK